MRSRSALQLATCLLLCGCAADPVNTSPSPDPEPGAGTPVPPASGSEPQAVLPVSFVSLRVRAEGANEEGSLQPGSSAGLEIGMFNAGPDLVDYPSVVLTCPTPGIHITEPRQILYGIVADRADATLLYWRISVDSDVALGTEVTLSVQAFAHNSDQEAGLPAVGRGSFVIAVGQAQVDGE